MTCSAETKKTFRIKGFSEKTFIKDYKKTDASLIESTKKTMMLLESTEK